MKRLTATPQPLAYTFRQFYENVYPCSRARANGYASSGALKTFVDHGRRMVLAEDATTFVKQRAAAGGEVPPEVSAQKSLAGKKGRASQLAAMASGMSGEAEAACATP